PFSENRKQLIHARQRPRSRATRLAADQQIFLDRERWKKPASFGNKRNSTLLGFEGGCIRSGPVFEMNFAAGRMHQTGNALEELGLAAAVCTDNGDNLGGADVERDAEERLEIAVECVDRSDFEKGTVRHRRRFPYRFQLLVGYG